MKTLFEKIIDRELPAKIIYENDTLIVIEDKYPKAPIHFLLIPKKRIKGIQELQDPLVMQQVVEVAQNLQGISIYKMGTDFLSMRGLMPGKPFFICISIF